MPLVQVQNLHKSFQTEEGLLPVLRGVQLDVDAGQQIALTGESGSGKSTLLYLIGALDSFDSGEIIVADQALSALDDQARAELRRTSIGIIFQQFNLIPSLTVLENLRFYARLSGRENATWTGEIAKRLGLADFLSRYPEQLSGGQQQRVAIGRVLAAKPRLILADEPTGNLDEETSTRVIDLMVELADETGAALLMVTHSKKQAARMNHQVHLASGLIC